MKAIFKRVLSLIVAFSIVLPMMSFGVNVSKAESLPYDTYNEIGGIDNYEQQDYDVVLNLKTGEKIRIQFYKDDMVRIYMDPKGEFQENPTPNQASHIGLLVDKQFDDYINEGKAVQPKVTEEDGVISISGGVAELRINKENSLMTLLKGDKVIWEEIKPLNHKEGSTIQTLKNHDNEYFFGGGMQNGRFTHRGEKIRIVNENGWSDGRVTSPAPFYWSTNGYGVIRNTFKPGEYDFGSKDINTVTTTHNEDRMDAIYFIGETPSEVFAQYTDIAGKAQIQTEFSFYPSHLNAYNRDTWVEDPNGHPFEDGKRYKEYQPAQLGNRVGVLETLNGDNQFSARAVIDRYVNKDMPLGWFLPNDGYGSGYGQTDSLDGDVENLRQFTEYANARGIEAGLWTQSALHPVDPENPKKGERDFVKEVNIGGVRALKTDVAWVGPGYSFGLSGITDTANILEDMNARSTVITLDGWVGTHRYATVWSGDQSGGQWEYIRFHIPTYIGSGLGGLTNVGSDMDGIFGGSPLIMTRDTQWKVFSQMMLYMDGWGTYQKNPWEHGEPYTSINRNYIKLKTELLPYSYSLNKESSESGFPYLRAMFLEYPNEYTYSKATQYQYLYGSSFLVAPVYQDTQMDAETFDDIRNNIYLPEGETWIDYFSGEQYEGGQILNNFDAPFWKLPVFVKNDSIIPMNKPNNNPSEIDREYRIFDIYADEHAEFEVYEDDGKTLDYKKGESATTNITADVENEKLTVQVSSTQGNYPEMVKERNTEFRVNVRVKPENISLKVGENEVELTSVDSQEEFEKGSNVFYFNPAPEFNRFATEGSDFEKVEIKKTPVVYVKTDKVDITQNEIVLTIDGFSNEPEKEITATELPQVPANFRAEGIDSESITLAWDEQENTDTFEVEFEGQIYTNIIDATYRIFDLKADSEYSFRVRARNSLGVSEWSEEIVAKTELDPYRNAIKAKSTSLTATDQSGTPFSNMFDLDLSTNWHTTWGISQTPMSGTVDFGKIYELDQMEYHPRVDAGNGTITKYSIDTSIDGRNWTEGEELTWERNGEVKLHSFGDTKARFIRINIKSAVGGFGSGNEFFVLKDDGTEGKLLGDTNVSNTVDSSDLRFFSNYAGLKTVDGDWEGYVGQYDYNSNGVIDAYDIALVKTIESGRAYQDNKNIAGKIFVNKDKESVLAGDTVTLTISGENLNDLNAFSVELDYDRQDFELASTTPLGEVENWESFSKTRTHSDNSDDIHVIYVNNTADSINGNTNLVTVELKALRDVENIDIPTTNSLLVDTNLYTKDGSAEDETIKISHEFITVDGDESAYENRNGSPLSNVNDGNRDSFAELMWDYEPNHDENGKLPENVKLPQEITLTPNERIENLHHINIVKRPNGNGSVKDINIKVYDGENITFEIDHTLQKADQLVEIPTNNASATKVVVTVLNTYDSKNTMMTLAEIELFKDNTVETAPEEPETEVADKTDLEKLFEELQSFDPNGKTEESVKALENALLKALEVYADEEATQEEVDNALAELKQAIENVENMDDSETEVVDKTDLEKLFEELQSFDPNGKTEESVKALEDALVKALEVYYNQEATQEEVDNAIAELEKAIENIEDVETPEEPEEPAVTEVKGYINYETNLRETPNGKVITTIPAVTEISGIQEGNWIKVSYDGVEGYVYKDLVYPNPLVNGYINYSTNLRETPNGEVISTIPAVTKVSGIIEGNWVKVSYNGEVGYVYKDLVYPNPLIEGYINYSTNLRETPNGKVIATIPAVTEISGIQEGNWIKVSYNGVEGYVYKDLVYPNALVKGYINYSTNLRETPNGKVIATIPGVTEVSGITEGNWIKVSYNGEVGYVYKDFVSENPLVKVVVKAQTNLRQTPNGKIITTISKSTQVSGIQEGNWVKINYNGVEGYVYSEFLEK